MSARLQDYGFLRVAVCAPELLVGDVTANVAVIAQALGEMKADGVDLAVFPELCLTGYSCGDLFYQELLLEAARAGVAAVAEAAEICAVIGAPLRVEGRLYNCAIVVGPGGVAGVVPKSCLPNTNEYYEERWFARAAALGVDEIDLAGQRVPMGTDLIFESTDDPRIRLGVEICEDLWGAEPLSGPLATAGATLIANPSAGSELLGKADYRRELVRQQSARCLAAYAYAGAGPGESSTDVVFSGHGIVAECGAMLAETKRFAFATTWQSADVDLDRIATYRATNSTFSASASSRVWRGVPLAIGGNASGDVRRPLPAHPFIPDDAARRAEHCREIFAIQSTGLAKRLRHTQARKLVLGLSGGLDSTLALLVGAAALRALGRPVSDIEAVVMPGPGSTDRTQRNAEALATTLGAGCRVIPIGPAVSLHLADIGHAEGLHDVTFENAQARERTQILMDVANQTGGIVLGTGDLSELALGWCTFNGDHMSMYHVNAGVPKTLVRHLVTWGAEEEFSGEVSRLLRDIVDTPISPELLPLAGDQSLVQKTEDAIGAYELHDFFLFHAIRNHFRPAKVFLLAQQAFRGRYDAAEIARVLRIFYTRFFASQFKRSAMPDGPKVGTVALSPRGDWRMPSDAVSRLWERECEALLADLQP